MKLSKTEQVALISVVVTLGLTLLKFGFYLLTGSVALLADAVHSFTDTFTSILVFLGIKISKRKTASFPYGLYKVENMVSLFISFAIFYAGYEIVREAVAHPSGAINLPIVAAAAAAISTVVSYGLSVYKLKAGKKFNSPSLIADGHHSRSDALSSIVVLVGVLTGFDRIAALIIVFFVIKAGVRPFIDSLKVLLDASIDPETLLKVKDILKSDPRVVKVKSLKGRNSGSFKFIEAVIELKAHSFEEAHEVSEKLERAVKREIPNVDEILIHYEPVSRAHCRYAIPVVDENGTRLSEHLSSAPFFVLVDVDGEQVKNRKVIANPYAKLERHKGPMVAKMLAKNDVDCVIVSSEPPGGVKFILEGMGIELIIAHVDMVEDALKFALKEAQRTGSHE